jgi:SAM-dependent methyltransferase
VNQQIQELMPQIAELENSLDQIDAEFMGITESDVQISTEEVAQKIAEKLSTERIQRAELEAKVQEIFEGKYTNDEIQAMLALADLRAEALGMTTDQWVEQNLVLPVSLEMNDGVNTQYKGVTSFIEDGQRAIIAMNEKADVSTWIHEFTHATRRQLSDEQNNTLLEWTGESEWNTRAEEIVAVGMEEYMYTGRFNVPKAIQTIFKQLKKMIGKVYNSIKWLRKQNQDQPALTDAVARVFDEMFTPGSIRNPDVNGNVNSRSVTPAEQDQTDMPLFQTKDHRHPTTMFQRLVIDMDKVLEWKEIADFETVEDRALHNAKAEVMEALWGEEALTEDITYELQKITPEKVGDAEYTNQMLEYIGDRRFFEEIYEEQLDWANDDAELVTNFDPGTDLWEWAKSVKGTTDDINEAGYILPDGTLLDFSGKRDGGPMGDRAEDHRQLGLPTEEYITGTDLMLAFMEDGAIRIDANSGLVDIARRPTFDQEAKIREVLEMNPDNGYVEMDDGERQYAFAVNNPRAAIGRIRRWFNGEDFEEDILFQIVYHGTPHTFDRFSLDYMGTGEGAQVFGWGLYFTDQESIGRHYAKVLARKKIENLYNFKPISDALIAEGVLNDRQIEIAMRAVRVNMKTAWADPMPFLERELSRHRYEFMKAQQMIDAARAELATPEKYRSKYARDIDKSIMLFKNSKNRAESNFSQYWGLKKAIELLKQDDQKVLEQKIIQPARNLYKVSLPENAQWIQWNKEYTVEEAEALFSRFPEVKEFIALKDQILVDAIFDENTGDQGEVVARMNELRETEAVKVFEKWGTYSHLTGERLVKSLEDMKNPRAASLWLKRNFGVLGTKFPASSMGRGDGSKGWNYVVFDDAAVAIEEHIMFQQDLKPIPESEGGNLPPATWDYLFENGYKPENASDTQITTTVPTYMAIAEDQEKSAVILDYSAGLGHGTKAMREAGYTVDGYEPFTNPEKRAVDPEFTREDASDIPSERYDVVINNAVLNVVPMATRVDIVKNIYRALKPGGSAYIQARNWGGIKPTLKNPKTKLVGPREVITGKGTFQKGFTQPELTAFIQEILPEAIVERGKHGDIKVKVTKPEILFQRDQSIDPTEGDQRISVRKGTEKTDKVPAREATILGLESILSRPGLAKKYAAIFEGDPNAKRPKKITDDNFIVLTEGYAGFKRPEGMSDEEYLTRIVNQMADNLMFLYNLESPEFRERSRKWYDAAYAISKEWGRQYGVPHQAVAGAIAALSSQKDWNQNVSIAKRIMDGLMNLGDERMDDQVRAHAEKWLEDSKGSKSYNTNVSIYESIGDKTLNELEDPDAAGMFIRFWDEVYNQNNFRVIEPDGTFSGYKITGKGARAKIQYGSFSELGKAVSIFRDPSPENISAVISAAPKVRSFYNNILMPWSDRGEITVDTHAVAGALLQPLGGSAIEVDVALSDKGSAAEGVRGTNPIFAEAYRIAADRAGVLPREMQSITWVAAQQGFDGKKDDKRRREAYNIWKGVEGFNQEQAEDAREQIRILFDLASTDEGTYIATDAYDGDEVYPGELSDRERSRAGRGATDGIVESGDLGRSAERSGNTRARGLRKDLLFQGDQEEVNPERDARREELQAALENSEHVPLENLQEFSDEEWADAAIFEITFNGMDSVQYEPAPGDYDKVVEGGDDGFPPNDSNAQHDYELLMDQDLWGDYQLNDYINDTKQFDPKRLPSRESANQAVLDSYANPEGMEALRTAVRSARARHEALDGIGFGGKQFTYFSARQPNQAQLDAAIREAEANPNGFREATHKILALNKSEEDQVASLIDDLINKYEPLATDDPEASRRVAREEDDRRRKAAVADLFDDIQQKIKVIRGDIKKDEVKKAFSDVRKDLKEVQARYAKSVNRADALERDLYETNRAASRLQDKVKKDKKLTDSEIKALKKRVATLDERSKKYKAKATKERQNVRQAVKEMKMIYRSLNRAKKLVEYQQNLIGQIKRLSQRKNVDFAYKEMVRHLLDGLSFEIMGPRKREQFNKERQIFKEYREANPDMNISEEWMNRYYQTYLQDYTIDDLELLKARVKEIIDAGATVMKVKKAARARRIQSNVIRLQDSLLEQLRRTNSGLTTDELREQVTTRTRLDDERNRLKGAFYGTITPQYLFDRLDGGRDFSGPFMDIFYNVAQDVTEDRQRMVQSRTDAAQAKIEELGITDEELLEPFYDMGGQDLNIQETIGLYTKMQNEKAANAIMYGNKFPLEQVYKAIEQLPSKFKDLGDWIIEHGYGDHYYRLREAFIENENAEMGMEERYTPIQRKSIIGTELDQQIKDDLLGSMALAPAKTQDGFTKSRVSIPADWQTPIRLDEWTMLLEMIDKQEHYIHATQAVKDMAAVLKDRTLQQLIAEVHDPEAVKTVDRWIQRFAAPSRFKTFTPIDQMFKGIRRNAAMAYLAFNMMTPFKQLPSYLYFIAETDVPTMVNVAGNMANGARRREFEQRMYAYSPQLKDRNIERYLNDFKTKNAKGWEKIQQMIGKPGMWAIRQMDRLAVTAGWNAVFDYQLANGKTDVEAARIATNTTMRTQPVGDAKDISDLFAQPGAISMFTQFGSQLNQIWSATTHLGPAMQAQTLNKWLASMTSIIIGGFMMTMMKWKRPPEDEEEWTMFTLEAVLGQFINSVPIAGSIFMNALAGFDSDLPISAPITATANVGREVVQVIQGDKDFDAGSIAKKAWEGVSIYGGIPYIQPKRIIDGIADTYGGDPKTDGDWINMIITMLFGRPKRRRN